VNGKQHYALGEIALEDAKHAQDRVNGYCLAAIANAHFTAALAAAHLGFDREELLVPEPPKPVSAARPAPRRGGS
jgi:hypothetical protein